jgi:hypothetical protein
VEALVVIELLPVCHLALALNIQLQSVVVEAYREQLVVMD